MPHLWHVEPPLRFERTPFDSAMRHKRGSRIDLSHPETSCYVERNNDRCSVTSNFIDQLIESILKKYVSLLMTEVLALIAQISASNASVVWPGVFPGSLPLRAYCYAAIVGTILVKGNRLLNTAGRAQARCEKAAGWSRRIAFSRIHKSRATRQRREVPSCCTCGLAMLAKPRF
jgi:hypothetical protein